jgi:hypothetical protein
VSNRTRSKADYTDQHIGSRTRSKVHNINVNNLSVQNLFFPLNDAMIFQGHGKSQARAAVNGDFVFGLTGAIGDGVTGNGLSGGDDMGDGNTGGEVTGAGVVGEGVAGVTGEGVTGLGVLGASENHFLFSLSNP